MPVVTFGSGSTGIEAASSCLRHLHLGKIDEKRIIELFQASDLLLFSFNRGKFF